MKLACTGALLLAIGLGGCAGHPTRQELADLAEGRCDAPPDPGPLRLEARADEGVFRIHNDGAKPFPLYYHESKSFGAVLLFHRMREAGGEPINLGSGPCDWSTPADRTSELLPADAWRLRIKRLLPARGFVDLKDNVDDMVAHHSGVVGGAVYRGPCQMQVKLSAYPRRRTYRRVEAATDWLPSPCPQPYRGSLQG